MFDKNNVLIIAAHPDDEVLGVGGTIPLIVENGGQVTVLIVTDGSSTQYEGDADIAGRKATSTEEANGLLDTREVIQWGFPDMRLDTVAHVELNQAFEKLLVEGQYDTVFVHHHGDINLDHRLIHESLLVAARPQPGQIVRSVYTYPVNSSTEWGERRPGATFVPNFYVDISATIEKKLDAMACYKDEVREHPHPRSIKALRDRAAVYGSEVGCEYAEAFRLILAIR
jgi:LmbE family N-acetylglucosaminyl deacetylase